MHWRCHTPVCMVMYLMLCIIIEFIGPGKLRIYSLVCLGPETHPVFDGAFSFGLSTHSIHCRPSYRLFTFLREWNVMLAHDELYFIDVSILTHVFGNGMGLVVCNMNITDSFIYAAVKNMIYWGSGVYIHMYISSNLVPKLYALVLLCGITPSWAIFIASLAADSSHHLYWLVTS